MPAQSSERALPLAVTMGDPAGIGPEIVLKAYARRADRGLAPFAVYGCPKTLAERARLLGLDVAIGEISAPSDAPPRFSTELPVLPIVVAREVSPGTPLPENAMGTISAIEQAVRAVVAGDASAIVTAPIAKAVLYAAGFIHPGHTEFLAALAGSLVPGKRHHPVMMLASDVLRVVPVTIHVPLSDVPRALSKRLLYETINITWRSLKSDFGIDEPRVAVAGLNPHAGEGGTIGREDIDLIAPAIEELRREGLSVSGPHSADTLFHAAARKNYDAAVCMYHDQALIPIKTLSFDTGVNVTLGLPFVRTSPDHGTAFDIAAKGIASPESMISAIRMATDLAERRRSRDLVSAPSGAPAGDGLPPLRDVIRRHDLAAKKSLGQNFILDLNLTRRIARLAAPLENTIVLEIGPGPGGLTRALLLEGAKRVIAIERDARCLAALADISAAYPDRLTVHEGDALDTDWRALTADAGGEVAIVANLPYNIATLLLVDWLETEPWPPWWNRMALMFQKEVAERIVAEPGSKAYGRLAVIAQWRAKARLALTLPPAAFTPPPKVSSAVVVFEPRPEPEPACSVKTLGRVTRSAFGQRRKMLRQSLKTLTPLPELLLREAGISPELRAEQLTVEDFALLAQIFERGDHSPV